MADMLSQEEINALLGMASADASPPAAVPENDPKDLLSTDQIDILGEVGNINMGTAATTLSALLNHRVNITTPVVYIMTWLEVTDKYDRPCVGVRIDYTQGIRGTNVLVLENRDVKIITNLMMGGDGNISDDMTLNEFDLSAIGEAMNQMIGSASTSLASLIKEKIDIATPMAFEVDFSDDSFFESVNYSKSDYVAATTFRVQVGDLIDSMMMQVIPIEFAKELVEKLMIGFAADSTTYAQPTTPMPPTPPPPPIAPPPMAPPPMAPPPMAPPPMAPPPQQYYQEPPGQQQYYYQEPPAPQYYYQEQAPPPPPYRQEPPRAQNVNAKPVEFHSFDAPHASVHKENIDLLMDVPLEVSVELGRTSKTIEEILEFSPGTVIELDKLAGEPIDILINGKYIARGEVVVIDENFAIRITSIVSSELRF